MKIGRLITLEGIEFSIECSQLRELVEHLRRQEINETLILKLGDPAPGSGFVDPEDYERAVQAAYFAGLVKSGAAAAQKIIR